MDTSASKPTVKLVKLFDPTRHPTEGQAQCIASQDVGNLRSFLNWVNEKPAERAAFKKNDNLIYKVLDENGKDISLGSNKKLITSLSKINYSSSDQAHEVPNTCSNLK